MSRTVNRRRRRGLIVVATSVALVGLSASGAISQPQAETNWLQALEDCEGRDLKACNSVGIEYERRGLFKQAAQYMQKVCDGGVPIGCSNLAELYYDGRGVPQDRRRAYQLFKPACDAKLLSGCGGVCISLFGEGNAAVSAKLSNSCLQVLQAACDEGNPWMCPHAERLRNRSTAAPPTRPSPVAPASTGACSDSSAELLGRAYFLSSPVSPIEEFRAFVANNRASFDGGGDVVRCARALGAHLKRLGNAAYDPKAYERAMGRLPDEHAPEVARSLNSPAVDLFALGEELVWLAEVLPAASRGDFQPFLTGGTGTRQMLRQAIALFESLAAANSEGFIKSMAQMFGPISELQILMLARMMPR